MPPEQGPPSAFGIDSLTREVRQFKEDLLRSQQALSVTMETRLWALEAGLCRLDERLERIATMSQEQYQQLSDLLGAQSGALKEEHQEVVTKLDELAGIITDLQGRVGQDLQPLIEQAQANLEETRGIITNDPAPPEPVPSPAGRRK